ncbi:hypothetical protein OHC33_003397 [Knufia fluminis]|uniref:Uncharacterized protein n=1 Tax=Knufia fluminis TaxID=191047 RepID=A0AAN8EXE5_9EURO|nr:hypothetical protein OHC33_003397 [Knufia fluminis]
MVTLLHQLLFAVAIILTLAPPSAGLKRAVPGLTPDIPPRPFSTDFQAYEVQNSLEFYQFDGPNGAGPLAETYKQWVKMSLIEVHLILRTTLEVLATERAKQPRDRTNVSFLRYFFPRDLETVMQVFERILAAYGCPAYEQMKQQCIPDVPKLVIFYNDPPVRIDPRQYCAKNTPEEGTIAYQTQFKNEKDEPQESITFCPSIADSGFFARYGTISSFDLARNQAATWEGPAVFKYCRNRWDEPTWSSAFLVLHELIHNSLRQEGVMWNRIFDLLIRRPEGVPEAGGVETAYGPFNAMHIKDWNAELEYAPTLNDDNYVFLAVEIFWKKHWSKSEEWLDPQDPYLHRDDNCPELTFDPAPVFPPNPP